MLRCNLILNELVTGKRAEGGQRKKAIIIMTIKHRAASEEFGSIMSLFSFP